MTKKKNKKADLLERGESSTLEETPVHFPASEELEIKADTATISNLETENVPVEATQGTPSCQDESVDRPITKPVQNTEFNLEGVGRSQEYYIRSMLVLADCCVQGSPDRVFDVLARNFDSTGAMEWWLHRIGLGHKARFVKGKDLVDAVRKLSFELFKDLRKEIGRPVARWL